MRQRVSPLSQDYRPNPEGRLIVPVLAASLLFVGAWLLLRD